MKPVNLEQLKERGLLWRGTGAGSPAGRVERTGWSMLDDLVGGGWPRAALSEILGARQVGMSLALPVLARLGEEKRWLAWVAPPHVPYAPTLAAAGIAVERILLIGEVSREQALWAAEQALGSGACAAVLLWPGCLETAQLRRLQLAAERGDSLGLLFRSLRDTAVQSPAALRLRVQPSPTGLEVEVLKRRGGWGGGRCCLRA